MREGKYGELMRLDQLRAMQRTGLAFVGFTEGEYTFEPTFKMLRAPGFEYTVGVGRTPV